MRKKISSRDWVWYESPKRFTSLRKKITLLPNKDKYWLFKKKGKVPCFGNKSNASSKTKKKSFENKVESLKILKI